MQADLRSTSEHFLLRCQRMGWTATATDVSPWGDVPGNMLDGDINTRYSSGTGQYNGLSFTVDMGQTETFDKIVIDSGSGSNDYARSSDVFVSADGTNWTKVSSVTGTGPVQLAAFQCTDSSLHQGRQHRQCGLLVVRHRV